MPFADYESMEECKRAHSDKRDPGAYCASIHERATGEWPGQSSAADFYADDPALFVKHSVEAMEELGMKPTEDKLESVRQTERDLIARG